LCTSKTAALTLNKVCHSGGVKGILIAKTI
jgi:hypothetical protein